MMCWYAATQLLDNNLLQSVINLDPPNLKRNNVDPLIGWPALMQLIRCPPSEKFHAVHRACLEKFDAFTLQNLASLSTLGENESLGISSYESALLHALLDLGGLQTLPKANLCNIIMKVGFF